MKKLKIILISFISLILIGTAINYDFSETGISEELSEKLLKAVPVCATYNVGDIGNLEYV